MIHAFEILSSSIMISMVTKVAILNVLHVQVMFWCMQYPLSSAVNLRNFITYDKIRCPLMANSSDSVKRCLSPSHCMMDCVDVLFYRQWTMRF